MIFPHLPPPIELFYHQHYSSTVALSTSFSYSYLYLWRWVARGGSAYYYSRFTVNFVLVLRIRRSSRLTFFTTQPFIYYYIFKWPIIHLKCSYQDYHQKQPWLKSWIFIAQIHSNLRIYVVLCAKDPTHFWRIRSLSRDMPQYKICARFSWKTRQMWAAFAIVLSGKWNTCLTWLWMSICSSSFQRSFSTIRSSYEFGLYAYNWTKANWSWGKTAWQNWLPQNLTTIQRVTASMSKKSCMPICKDMWLIVSQKRGWIN